MSAARPGPALPAASAAASEDSGELRVRVFSVATAPRRDSWATPGSCSPGTGSGLWPLGRRRASRVPGSSTCTVTSSRNLEKGSLASCRWLRRARGPVAGPEPMLGGSRVGGRPGDSCASSWPGHAAQLEREVWPSGLRPGLGLSLRLRGSSLRAPFMGASALGSTREPCLGLLGSGPRAWDRVPESILLSQPKVKPC